MAHRVRSVALQTNHRGSAPTEPETEEPPNGRSPRVAPVDADRRRASPATFPFVGRDEELDWLKWVWKEAVRGRGRVVLVAGEPGIGKTRLAQELVSRVSSRKSWVMVGDCDVVAPSPYRPVLGGLRHCQPPISPQLLRSQVNGADVDLVRLLTGISDSRHPEMPGDEDATGSRRRVLDAITATFDGMTRAAPAVLVLDDMERADRSTLVAVSHLAELAYSMPLLVFGTYCETAIDRADPLFELIHDLRDRPGYERRVLGGLSLEAVQAIIPDRELATVLWRISEGNPLCIQQLIEELHQTGAINPDRTLRPDAKLPWDGNRMGVRSTIEQRLDSIDAGTLRVLGGASVVGPEFDLYTVAYALRISVDKVQLAVRRALKAGVVRAAPPRSRTYRFTHALFRQLLYKRLEPSQRVRLHGQVAEALQRRPSDDPDDLALLAFHLERSSPVGRSDKLMQNVTLVGDHAMAVGGYEDAAEHYSRALGAAGNIGAKPERADLLVSLSDAHWRSGDHLRARTAALEAATAARNIGDGHRLARAALALGRVAPVWGRDEVITRVLEEALAMMKPDDPLVDPVRARLDRQR